MKLQVIDVKTNSVANPLKCLIRNLTIIIWPIEVIMAMIDPERRLGDKIAGTRIEYNYSPEKLKNDWKKIVIAFLISLGFTSIVFLPFLSFQSGFKTKKVAYVETSYDKTESEKIIQFTEIALDSLIKEVDFKVYNEIEEDSRKYISGILYFKNRNDYDNFEQSEKEIIRILNSEYLPEKYIYFLKFVYKEPGSISTRQKHYNLENE